MTDLNRELNIFTNKMRPFVQESVEIAAHKRFMESFNRLDDVDEDIWKTAHLRVSEEYADVVL